MQLIGKGTWIAYQLIVSPELLRDPLNILMSYRLIPLHMGAPGMFMKVRGVKMGPGDIKSYLEEIMNV